MTDPLATLAAEQRTANRVRDIADGNIIRWDGDHEWIVDHDKAATAILDGYTATWELDGHGLRRLVLRGPWETDPRADTR